MRNFLLLFIAFVFTAFAQSTYKDSGQILSIVNGAQTEGCTQVSVTTTGHNRSGPYTAGKRYLVYGYDSTNIATGDAVRCVWGSSTIDVTSIGGSKVGEIIFANQQRVYAASTDNLYISCISKTASMKVDVCGIR